jgi:hypothetical protein
MYISCKGGEAGLGAQVGANGWGKGKYDKACFYFGEGSIGFNVGECSMFQKYLWWANQMTLLKREKKEKKEKLSR